MLCIQLLRQKDPPKLLKYLCKSGLLPEPGFVHLILLFFKILLPFSSARTLTEIVPQKLKLLFKGRSLFVMYLNNTLAQGGCNYTGRDRWARLRDWGSRASYHTHDFSFFLLRQLQTASSPSPVPLSKLLGLPSSQQSLVRWFPEPELLFCVAFGRVFFKGYVQTPLSAWELLASIISQGNFTAAGGPFC